MELGRIHRVGIGVPKNPVEAYKWYYLASEMLRGSSNTELYTTAIKNHTELSTTFSRAESERAIRDIEAWQARQDLNANRGGVRGARPTTPSFKYE